MLLFLMISLEKFGSTFIFYKSDVPNISIKFHKFISNTTSYKIINFKSDNDTEYINKTLTIYLFYFILFYFIQSVLYI